MKIIIDSSNTSKQNGGYFVKIPELTNNISNYYRLNKFFTYKSFYTISAERGNNVFKLFDHDAITIPDGNYSETAFVDKLQTELKKITSAFTVYVNPINYKLVIQSSIVFQIDYPNTTCKKIIGIPDDGSEGSLGSLWQSPLPCNFSGFYRLNMHIDNYNVKSNCENTNIAYSFYNIDSNLDGTIYSYNQTLDDTIYLNGISGKQIYFTFDDEATKISVRRFIAEFIVPDK